MIKVSMLCFKSLHVRLTTWTEIWYFAAANLTLKDYIDLWFQVYIWVLGSNLILRCTWTYKLSAHLRHNYLTVFTITALEIFRRFQWIFFRVENEWNKMNLKSNIQITMSNLPTEEDKLLNSSSHNV